MIDPVNPPTIMTRRLVIRPHQPADLDDLAAMWADPEVTRHIGITRDRQDTWLTMARLRGFWSLIGYGFWVVRDRRTDSFIGEAGFADFQRGLVPDISGAPEAGWAFAKSAWNQGYGTEAVSAMHTWLDETRPATRSTCVIEPDNRWSVRLAEKLGYTRFATTLHKGMELGLFQRTPP
ncbi:MAG: GNAT family N-acetyltransferase [Pseudomonadota bacterium]